MSAGRSDIVDAAFRLFAERGYDATSVDDIAAAAGVSRSTFFRSYGSKEAVIFPDHDALVARVEDRLRSSHEDSGLAAVVDAVKLVLFHYVAEGDRARERYRLVSSVPALRERELIGSARYQQLFRQFLSEWGDGSAPSELRAELRISMGRAITNEPHTATRNTMIQMLEHLEELEAAAVAPRPARRRRRR